MRYVKGIEKGPVSHAFKAPVGHFFHHVVSYKCSLNDRYINAAFFSAIGTNKPLNSYFVRESVFLPLKFELEVSGLNKLFGSTVYLISIGEGVYIDSDGEEARCYDLIYQNLSKNCYFVDSFKNADKLASFKEAAGFEAISVGSYDKAEVFTVKVDGKDAGKKYKKKIPSIVFGLKGMPLWRRFFLFASCYLFICIEFFLVCFRKAISLFYR